MKVIEISRSNLDDYDRELREIQIARLVHISDGEHYKESRDTWDDLDEDDEPDGMGRYSIDIYIPETYQAFCVSCDSSSFEAPIKKIFRVPDKSRPIRRLLFGRTITKEIIFRKCSQCGLKLRIYAALKTLEDIRGESIEATRLRHDKTARNESNLKDRIKKRVKIEMGEPPDPLGDYYLIFFDKVEARFQRQREWIKSLLQNQKYQKELLAEHNEAYESWQREQKENERRRAKGDNRKYKEGGKLGRKIKEKYSNKFIKKTDKSMSPKILKDESELWFFTYNFFVRQYRSSRSDG